MKKIVGAAISLPLLLLLTGFAQAAALSVNLIGKWEGNAQAVEYQTYITSTPMIIRIMVQNGPLFHGTISFPNQTWNDGQPMNFNGAIYDGELHLTIDGGTLAGKFHQFAPYQISGCFQHPKKVDDPLDKAVTGVFVVKKTNSNPAAP
jgi:hypothetical protein